MNAMLSTRLESALVTSHHKRECGSDLFAIARRHDVTSAFARQHCADRSAHEYVPDIVALAARKWQNRHEAGIIGRVLESCLGGSSRDNSGARGAGTGCRRIYLPNEDPPNINQSRSW